MRLKLFKNLLLGIFVVTLSRESWADRLTIYAASSMTNAVEALGKSFTEQTGIEVVNVFAGSSTLARQIAYGAPADIFISANLRWVNFLKTHYRISEATIHPLVSNQLVVVTHSSNTNITEMDIEDIDAWQALGKDTRIAMGNISSVPVGIYSQQALQNMGIWSVVKDQTAQMNNVRQVLSLVERNEVSVGIVYYTDAIVSKKVTVINSIPDDKHDKIVYPLVMLKDSEACRNYKSFVLSPEGQAILADYGFNPIKITNPIDKQ